MMKLNLNQTPPQFKKEQTLGAICEALSEEAERAYINKLRKADRKDRSKIKKCTVPVMVIESEEILEPRDVEVSFEKSTCECSFECALLYCDYANILATMDRTNLDLTIFRERFCEVQRFTCDCEFKGLVLGLIEREDFITPQMFSNYIFGNKSVDTVVDEKLERVSTILNAAASNVKHGLTDDAKEFLDAKLLNFKQTVGEVQVKLAVPDVTGIGGFLTKMFSTENVTTSVITIFCILYLTRKYHPSIGDVCALFAGVAMCYVSTSLILPILLKWFDPTPQSVGEWLRVTSEVIGIGIFAAKGKWELNLSSIMANFVAIEREKPLIEQLLERIRNLVFSIIRLVAESLGKEFICDFSPMAEKIRSLRKRINSINKDPSRYRSPTITYVNDIFKINDDIMELYEDVSISKGSERYVTQIQALLNIIKPLVSYLEVNKFVSGSRFSSFIRTLVGFSGVGKTAISEELNRALFEEFATDDAKLAADNKYSNICYPVSSSQKFFESYKNQFVLQVNDYLQKKRKTWR